MGPANKILTLARDAMGIKPLEQLLTSLCYLAVNTKPSGLMNLTSLNWIELPLLLELLGNILSIQQPYSRSHSGTPGSVEVWSLDEFGKATLQSSSRFEQQIVQQAQSWDPDLQAQELLESFTYSVEQRLMADVPVGIVLSGGLDSSLVAAVSHDAANRAGQPVPECWTVAESEENPDWKAAEIIASSLDLKHHQHILAEDDFDNRLPDLVWHGEDLDTTVMFFQPLFEKCHSM